MRLTASPSPADRSSTRSDASNDPLSPIRGSPFRASVAAGRRSPYRRVPKLGQPVGRLPCDLVSITRKGSPAIRFRGWMNYVTKTTKAWQTADSQPLDADGVAQLDGWWRAANYLSVGQIYLLYNPLLRTPLARDDVKPRLLGHWGTTPGPELHLRAPQPGDQGSVDQSTIYVTGPGHGGPGLVANAYLDGTYSEVYPDITQDDEGIRRLFRQFSFPGGIPSHVAPETPGSIHEGGELGYALSHAYGAAFDNPDLLVAAVVGDGEAETGALGDQLALQQVRQSRARTAWCCRSCISTATRSRIRRCWPAFRRTSCAALMIGYGHNPYFFEVPDERRRVRPTTARRRASAVRRPCSTTVLNEIAEIKAAANARAAGGDIDRPAWPMIVFRTPKGWTGPDYIDGKKTTGSWRAHQVPLANARDTPEHLKVLADWLASYRADELFDERRQARPGDRRAGARGRAADERQPAHQRRSATPGSAAAGLPRLRRRRPVTPVRRSPKAPRVLGQWLTDVIRRNPDNFRIFGPDETASNRLQAVFDVTDKQWNAEFIGPEVDEHLARAGRVVEMLSEHQCQGWLEGYLLTGGTGCSTATRRSSTSSTRCSTSTPSG